MAAGGPGAGPGAGPARRSGAAWPAAGGRAPARADPGGAGRQRDQAHQPGARAAAGGLGLGLALAQRLAQGMGGQVGVDNHAPHGCTFWVSVPVPDGPPAPSDRKSGID
ncbi:MAG: hypothetical protein KA774_08520 [Burkholderiaceae bacterium]|nr:hypothetical protein [Burkholderiaceae bacterium]